MMSNIIHLFQINTILGVVLSIGIFLVAWPRRKSTSGFYLLAFTLAVIEWQIASSIEIIVVDPKAKILWSQILYIGFVQAYPYLFLFIVTYIRQSNIHFRMLLAVMAIPILTLLLVWTNSLHGWVWSGFSWGSIENNVLIYQHGFWFWVHTIYLYVLLLVGLVYLLINIIKSQSAFRHQLWVLLVGIMFPFITGTLYVLGYEPIPGLDITPTGLTMTGLFFAWGLLRYQLLDLKPFARTALVEQLHDGVIVLDPRGRIVDVNDATKKLLGLNPKGIIIGQDIASVYPILAELVVNTEKQILREISLPDASGTILEVENSTLFSQTHQEVGNILVIRDITARSRIEQALLESESRLLRAQGVAKFGNWELDLVTKTIWASAEAFRIYGIERNSEYLSLEVAQQIPLEKDRPQLDAALFGLIQKNEQYDLEFQIKRKDDDSVRVIHSVANLIYDAKGLPQKVVGVIQDITERKVVEDNLRESESKMRAIADSAKDAILMIDPQGRISYWNPAAEYILGYTDVEAMGQNLHHLIVPQRYHEAYHSAFPTFVQTGQGAAMGKSHELEACRKDGTEIPIQLSLSSFQMNGSWYAVGIISDITERKRSEKIQQLVYKIAQAMVTTAGIDELYLSIHTILKELLPVENFYIAIYDQSSDLISYPYVVDQFDEPPAPKNPGRGLTEYVLRTGRSILVTPEMFEELIIKGEVERVGSDSVDWMGSPLIVEGRIIGVMVMQSYSEKIRFNADDVKLLEFVSNQVALAIERKYAQKLQEHQSTHDRLTGLFNRQYYETEIERLQGSRQFPISILVMDVDGLKRINDLHGHSTGDELLGRAAAIIRTAFRPEDMVARVGGDEFVAVLPETDAKSASLVVKRLLNSFKKHNQDYSPDQHISISIGFAYGDHNSLLTEVFKEADQAMYRDKAEKKTNPQKKDEPV